MSELFSRREFFKKLVGKEEPDGNSRKVVEFRPMNIETASEFREKMSRRTVLEFLVGASLILTLPQLFPKGDGEKPQEEKEITDAVKNFTQSIDWERFDENLSKDSSYKEAILGQALIRIASEIGERILHDIKIKTGNLSLSNKDVEEMLEKAPLESYIRTVIIGPLIEEWVFRLIPSTLIADQKLKRKDTVWELGVPLSALFAWMHNIEDIKEGGKTTFKLHLDSVPLNQFMSGLFFWYLMRQKGFNHAALAHMFNNMLLICSQRFLIIIFLGIQKIIS